MINHEITYDIVSKRHHYPRCLSFVRAGGNAPSCSAFSASLLKDNYGRLIDFLNRISKLSCFNLIDLADVLMRACISSFPFRCLMWQSWVCADIFRALLFIGCSGGLIITAHTSPYLFCPPSSCRPTYNSHITKNKMFLAYFMHILNTCVV